MDDAPHRISDVWAIVPIKELRAAKQRLSEAFTPEERQALVLAMAEDVLRAIDGSAVGGVVVVTRDEKIAVLAAKFGARVIADAGNGESSAVNGVQSLLAAEGKRATIVVPGDVPLITPAEINTIAGVWREAKAFAIAPSHDLRGSNAVLCAPPNVMPLEFGPESFAVHLRKAEALGLAPKVVHLAYAAMDIDHPIDLYNFLKSCSDTKTHKVLSEFLSNIAEGIER